MTLWKVPDRPRQWHTIPVLRRFAQEDPEPRLWFFMGPQGIPELRASERMARVEILDLIDYGTLREITGNFRAGRDRLVSDFVETTATMAREQLLDLLLP